MIPSIQIAPLIADFCADGKPRVLMVTHAWGGGVEQHVTTLANLVREDVRVLILRPVDAGSVELDFCGLARARVDSADWPRLVAALRAARFDRLHLHHVHGLPEAILHLDRDLEVPLDCTLHDYMSVCPQYQLVDAHGRYCGEPDTAGCNACITQRPHAWGWDIESWRRNFETLLNRADRIFAPSQSVRDRLCRYFPGLSITVAPHPEVPVVIPNVSKVVLLGALSPAKGLAVAIDVAALAKQQQSGIHLRLIGHAAEPLPAGIIATGSYAQDELPTLLALERPDVLWLPSQVPETFSFALSAALATDLPIVASDIGALADRLRGRPNATLLPFNATTEQWHGALLSVASKKTAGSPITASRSDAPLSTVAEYVRGYLEPITKSSSKGDAQLLNDLIVFSAASLSPAPAQVRPLLDVFRVGVRGGHAPSTAFIEQTLQELPAGETAIVGRRTYDAISSEITRLGDELVQARDILDAAQVEHDAMNDRWRTALDEADERARAAREYIAHLERESTRLEGERAKLVNSVSWRVTRPLRGVMRVLRRAMQITSSLWSLVRRAPVVVPGALKRFRRNGWRGVLDRLQSEFRVKAAPAALLLPASVECRIAPLVLSTARDAPHITVLIPVYGQHSTTFACLKSIAEAPPSQSYEVLVVDDCSPEAASEVLSEVSGVRFFRQPKNLGFIGNVNNGAEQALGEWLIILNNDTVVRPGALDALVDTFSQHENVGLVGAKLLNADGTVQEAGGIVWRDGSAWNWGRGQDREDPRFNFVRDADYCSGAALAIRRDLFLKMGGFDTYYLPAYYEDTDLAFRIRARGLRVLYQPAAEVFHLEGVSHGRDESSGIKAYQATNAVKFYERWKTTLAGHRDNGVDAELEAHRASRSNILIIEACMVTPDQDSGSVRMLNLMKILKADGHHVTFVADNLDGDPKYAALLTSAGVEVLHSKFAGSVRKVLRERGQTLDAVIVCRHYIASQYVNTVRTAAPKAKVIFDTVDLHFIREEREAQLLGNAGMARAATLTRAKELAVIAKSDVTLVVSEFEKQLLAQIAPAAQVVVISNIHTPAGAPAPFEARTGILFVGGFRHPPNVDAIKWYVSDVLPHVCRLLPGVVTTVVGSNMPEEIKSLQAEGLLIRGFVEDTLPLLSSARVSIAPLRYGAGVKGKVNEAMNHGIPVVATSCAVEGMQLIAGHEVLVSDDATEFAGAIARAYNDAVLWQTLSAAGLANVSKHFSLDAARPAVRAALSR